MKRFPKTLFLLLLLLPAFLGADEPGGSFQFLNAVYSPRVAALGGTYASMGEDIASMYINPAGLARAERAEITFAYGDYLLDLKGGWLGFNYPLNGYASLGGGLIYFDYGSFAEADRFGDLTGNTFAARDMAVSGTIAGSIRRSFAWGVTLKYAYSKIDHYSAGAAAADAGILYRAGFLDGLTAGIALRNLGQSLDAYYLAKESLPAALSFALTKRINPSPVTIHAGWNNLWFDNDEAASVFGNFSVGTEIAALEQLTLRLGYNNRRNNDLEGAGGSAFRGISAGFGLQWGTLQFDYGYANYGYPGATHHFGLTFRPGDKKERPPRGEDRQTPQPDLSAPPRELRLSMEAGVLTLSWEAVAGAAYNVYVRLEDSEEWALVNKFPREENYLTLKAPKTKGTYIFRVTAVVDGKESYFSKESRLTIQ